jgi:hypothetical protein
MELYVPPSDSIIMGDFPSEIDPWTENVSQLFPLATKLVYGDRTFRYGKGGASTGVAGNLYQKAVPLAGHIDEAIDVPAVGDVIISFTPTNCDDIVANDFQDGYINIVDETGEGHLYKIKSHPAAASGVACLLTLYDSIRVAPAAGATATVTFNRWKNVIIQPGPATALLSGWAAIAFTASYYTWFQTHGPVSALAENTLVIGEPCVASPADPGAVGPWVIADSSAVEQPLAGIVDQIQADAEYATIWAMLE